MVLLIGCGTLIDKFKFCAVVYCAMDISLKMQFLTMNEDEFFKTGQFTVRKLRLSAYVFAFALKCMGMKQY